MQLWFVEKPGATPRKIDSLYLGKHENEKLLNALTSV